MTLSLERNGCEDTTESLITVSVDCLDYLGGETRDAAFVQVHSIPRKNSGFDRWQSHVIIDSVKDGIFIWVKIFCNFPSYTVFC